MNGEQFLVQVPPVGLGPHGAVHGRFGLHDCVGRDIFQHLYWAFAPSLAVHSAFSLKNVLYSFPVKEDTEHLKWDCCACKVWE